MASEALTGGISAAASFIPVPGVGAIVTTLVGVFENKQKYPNAAASAGTMRSVGAPDWLVNGVINKAYGYAGPGYLSGSRLLKRTNEEQQRDAQLYARYVTESVGLGATPAAWAAVASELGIAVPEGYVPASGARPRSGDAAAMSALKGADVSAAVNASRDGPGADHGMARGGGVPDAGTLVPLALVGLLLAKGG